MHGCYWFGFAFDATVQVGQNLLIHEISRSHTTHYSSVGLFWTSDQPVAETST